MKKITYEEFVERYKPTQNPYFDEPDASFSGTLFSLQDISFIYPHVQDKKVWSLIEETLVLDQIEERYLVKRYICPGVSAIAKGYFLTEVPFEELDLKVVLK